MAAALASALSLALAAAAGLVKGEADHQGLTTVGEMSKSQKNY